MTTVFVIFVVVGFILWFLAAWPSPPAPPYTEWAARGFFALAAVIWAVGAWKA